MQSRPKTSTIKVTRVARSQSPEQAGAEDEDGEIIDQTEKTDSWTFGTFLLRLVTGKEPWAGIPEETIWKRLGEKRHPPLKGTTL